jgi:hypothetical protein
MCSTEMGTKCTTEMYFYFCSTVFCKCLTLYNAAREYDANDKYGRHREQGDIAMCVISQNFDGGNDDSMQNLSYFKYRKLD